MDPQVNRVLAGLLGAAICTSSTAEAATYRICNNVKSCDEIVTICKSNRAANPNMPTKLDCDDAESSAATAAR